MLVNDKMLPIAKHVWNFPRGLSPQALKFPITPALGMYLALITETGRYKIEILDGYSKTDARVVFRCSKVTVYVTGSICGEIHVVIDRHY